MDGLDGFKERIKFLTAIAQMCATFALGVLVSLVTYISKKNDLIAKQDELYQKEHISITNPYSDPDLILYMHLVLFGLAVIVGLTTAFAADGSNDQIFRIEALKQAEKNE